MKITSILCFVLVACDAYPVAYADQKVSKFTTHFELSSVDEIANVQTSYTPYTDADVVMPQGSKWTCHTNQVARSTTNPNLVSAGFICYSLNGVIVAVNAACYDDRPNYRDGSMMVSSLTETNTNFFVSCETKVIK